MLIELQVQYMKIPCSNQGCFWHSEQFLYTTCSPHVPQKEELLTKIYLHSAQWSWYRKYHPKNKKKHWKFKCEKYAGFKAQMEKNRPIRDQFPHKNHVPIVKNPPFSWLYGLPMVPWAPHKCWGLQNKFYKIFKL